jgi:hypothetical protein
VLRAKVKGYNNREYRHKQLGGNYAHNTQIAKYQG